MEVNYLSRSLLPASGTQVLIYEKEGHVNTSHRCNYLPMLLIPAPDTLVFISPSVPSVFNGNSSLQNGKLFADDMIQYILLNGISFIFPEVCAFCFSWRTPALVQVMAWCRTWTNDDPVQYRIYASQGINDGHSNDKNILRNANWLISTDALWKYTNFP